jgi:hypothetical protein
MPTGNISNPPIELLPRLIAAAMVEEPTRECASCGGPCRYADADCDCDNDMMCERCSHAIDQFDRFVLREAVGSLLWNRNEPIDVPGNAILRDHAKREGAHANVEPRHLAALWEACACLIADAQEGK